MYKQPYQQTYNKNKAAKYILFAVIGIAIGAGIIGAPKFLRYINRIKLDQENQEVMETIIDAGIVEQTIKNIQNTPDEIEEENIVILENAYIDVPFVCQAPFQTEANWTYHEESCEEAALLQVHYYIEGVKEADKQLAHATILDMIDWQKRNLGGHKDLYANDMKTFIQGYYGYTEDEIEIIYDAGITDIKKAVSQGYPVIVPIMGNVLRNPYYPHPGYHMLTIIGYTPDRIITNDVGTRRGEDFSYTYDVFMKATKAAGGDIIVINKLPESSTESEESLVE